MFPSIFTELEALPRFAGPLNIIVPFLVSVDENSHKNKFETEEEKTNLNCK